MQLIHSAVAGTMESSDAMITIEPADTLTIDITSSVINQYGRQIKETVLNTLKRLDVENASVTVVDRGALDCTLRARVECAVFRAGDVAQDYPWEEVIKP